MKLLSKRSLFFFLLLLSSCMALGAGKVYRIGIDPAFFPLPLDGQGPNVYAFCNELLQEIAHSQKVDFAVKKRSWNTLEWGLKKHKYEGMLSSMPLYLFQEKKFDASPVLLKTGPILVTLQKTPFEKIDDLKGKIVATIEGSKTPFLLESYPTIIIIPYPSIPDALTAITRGEVEGALIPHLLAKRYVADLFSTTLQTRGEPLTEEGFRLITLHEEENALLTSFNKGLHELHKSGKFKELLTKWNL